MVFCLLFFSINPIFSVEKTIELGGSMGWNLLSLKDGVTTGMGRFGYQSMELDTNTTSNSPYTDLLLSFEDFQVKDITNKYSVESNESRIVSDSIVGKCAAQFYGNDSGIHLLGENGTIFGTEGWTGSFTIEFWICPSIIDNGETLVSWRSKRNIENYPLYQMLTAVFSGSRLEWHLTNLFTGYASNSGEIILRGIKTLIPGKWSHHALVYSEENGLLEYRVNGLTEDLIYISSQENERSSIYPLKIGNPAELVICSNFTGKLDNFSISRESISSDTDKFYNTDTGTAFVRYNPEGGRFETQPMSVASGSVLERIDAEINEPAQTDVQLYVRSGENFYEWTESFPEWIPIEPGKNITDVSGQFFQVAAQLYPDGAGSVTPSVTSISVIYTENDPPLPPFTIKAIPENSAVNLSWSASIDKVSGYYIYYGERPGEYLGRIALEGFSPIHLNDRNTFRISGLKNGRMYYFAIASECNGKVGRLSSEVYARPDPNK